LTHALMDNVQFWGRGMPGNMFARALKAFPTDTQMCRSSSLHDSLAIHLACGSEFVELQKLKFVVNTSGICTEDKEGLEASVCLDFKDMEGLLDHFVKRFCSDT